jgi:hypothetical protein
MATVYQMDVERQRDVSWRVPNHDADPRQVQQWVESFIDQGGRWLENSRALANLQADIRLLNGDQTMAVKSNQLLPDIRSFVETYSDVRKICSYTTKLDALKPTAQVYNGFQQHVFDASQFRNNTRSALQWATVGRGYLWPKYTIDRYGYGKGGVKFESLGPLDVVFDQLPASNDIQEGYAVAIVRPVPLVEAHARHERFQDQILPVDHYDWKKYGSLSTIRRMDFYSRFRFSEEPSDWARHYTELHYCFVRSLELNQTGKRLRFGRDGAPWSYEVPSREELIVTMNPFNGAPQSRKATEQDCLLYPQLRLIITCPTCPVPLYDGCAFDWHGEMPPVPYDLSDVAWSPLGPSIVSQVSSLERARRRLLSTSTELRETAMNPPKAYDLNAGVPQKQLNNLDILRAQGVKIGTSGDPSKKFHDLISEGMIRGAKDAEDQIKLIDTAIAKSLGLADIASLREMKMPLSQDSFEKWLNNMGPFGKGIVANEALAHKKIGNMLKYMAPEYYTEKQIMAYVGEDGSTLETFTFDPAQLDPQSASTPFPTEGMPRRQRCMWLAEQIETNAFPMELLTSTHQAEQMRYLFFLQHNMPISKSTCMEKLDVPNYGSSPGNTEREKFEWEQERDILREIKLKKMAIEETGEPPSPPDQQGKGGGPKPKGQTQPKLEPKGGKGGAPRAVLSTSK